MEALTGFFILEGLVFDIIGAILIVRGLSQIDPYKLKRVMEIEDDFISDQNKVMSLGYQIRNLERTHDNFEKRIFLVEIHQYRQSEHAKLGKVIPTQIRSFWSKKQHKHTLIEASKGLPFLIGGFLLQGIGVITQLN